MSLRKISREENGGGRRGKGGRRETGEATKNNVLTIKLVFVCRTVAVLTQPGLCTGGMKKKKKKEMKLAIKLLIK